MLRTLTFQQMPGPALIVQHEPQMGGEQGQPDCIDVELHTRTVIADGADHRCSCSCGYLSVAFDNAFIAERTECEVEHALAISQERRRRMYASRASMGVSR